MPAGRRLLSEDVDTVAGSWGGLNHSSLPMAASVNGLSGIAARATNEQGLRGCIRVHPRANDDEENQLEAIDPAKTAS